MGKHRAQIQVGGTRSFQEFLERVSLPYILITGVATSLANLHTLFGQIGSRVLAISTIVVAALWTYHVFTHAAPSSIAPDHLIPTYSRKIRALAVVLVFSSLVPLWLTFRPKPSFELPEIGVMIWNHSSSDVEIYPIGEFYITATLSPVVDSQVAAGKFQLGDGRSTVVVPPQKSLIVSGAFMASSLYEGFYRRGDLDIRLILRAGNGRLLPSRIIPFQLDWLTGEPVVFTVGE